MKTLWIALILSFQLGAEEIHGYHRFPDAAQNYQNVYNNVIRFERGISLERAFQISDADPSIDYFTYVTAPQWKACLHAGPKSFTFHDPYRLIHCDYATESGRVDVYYLLLHEGDVLFYHKEGRWLFPSCGMADTYCKSDPGASPRFKKEANRFQSADSDFQNAIRFEASISLEQAFRIAEEDPRIGYFCYVLDTMKLPIPPEIPFDPSQDDPLHLVSFIHTSGKIGWGFQRVFKKHNAIFFQGDGLSLTKAQGRADAYIRK